VTATPLPRRRWPIEIFGKLVNRRRVRTHGAALFRKTVTANHGGDWGWIERKTAGRIRSKKSPSASRPGKISNIVEFSATTTFSKSKTNTRDRKNWPMRAVEIEKKLISWKRKSCRKSGSAV